MSSIQFFNNKYWREKQSNFSSQDIEHKFDKGWETWSPPFVEHAATEDDLEKFQAWANSLHDAGIDHLIVVGIGGSSLGAKSLQQYYAPFTDKLTFWEGPHPQLMQRIAYLAETKKTALLWVSKSGKTLESITNLALFRQFFPGVPEYFVTSKPDKVKEHGAKEENIFYIPDELTGRYSVISAAGLLPGYFLRANMNNFMEGYKEGLYKGDISNPISENGAKMTAIQLHQLFKGGYENIVFWIYARELLVWGEWLTQLWGESLGKKPEVTAFPTVVRGPEAQHSLFQYFMESQNKYLHSFIHTDSYGTHDAFVPDDMAGEFSNHSLWEILQAQMKSIEVALTEKERPVSEFLLPCIYTGVIKDPTETTRINRQYPNMKLLGEWMAYWMLTVTYLSYLYEVNPFNQPSVETGKKYCRDFLKSNDNAEAIEKNMDL
ncbi:MAG: hypothetical protein OEZ13_06150 [Spirochaetia bacterium]|nr:hypothetical protein [Spirochaetia bacterium]